MAVYNVNQNRQFYVVNSIITEGELTKDNDLGAIEIVTSSVEPKLFAFKHLGKGGITRSDFMDVDKITYANITYPNVPVYNKIAHRITLNADVNEGKPIVGQDYILRIQLGNYLSPGGTLVKSCAVRATKAMYDDTSVFFAALTASLKANFSREEPALVEITQLGASIEIVPAEQPWKLGVMDQGPVTIEIAFLPVNDDGQEVIWGNDYKDARPVVGNGKKVADLEYFCMGERGDQFRKMGWPNSIDVEYMVDPKESYYILDLHYFYSGDGVQNHKSEKDLTLVTTNEAVVTYFKALFTTIKIPFTEIEAPESE